MNDLEDRLTEALDRRGADVAVSDRLDAIVEGTNIVRFDAPHPRRTARLLSVAAAVALLAVGVIAVTQYGGGETDDVRDDGTATQPDVPEGGAILPRPLAAVDSLADDEWVIPTLLPEGFEFQYAADTSTGPERSQMVVYGVGASQGSQIILSASGQGPTRAGTALVVDGVEWTVSSDPGARVASRRVGDDEFTIGGLGSTDVEVADVLASLVVVTDTGLPERPIVFNDSMTPVGVFMTDGRELTVKADGSNGWFCTGLFSGNAWGGGCASFFDPANHLAEYHSGGSESADRAREMLTSVSGLSSVETTRVEVEWIDGTITSVAPQNSSDRFADVRFWATGTTIELDPGQSPDSLNETVVEVRAYDAGGALLATSRNGTLTVE